jgi:hypothetical protein
LRERGLSWMSAEVFTRFSAKEPAHVGSRVSRVSVASWRANQPIVVVPWHDRPLNRAVTTCELQLT